MSIQAVSWALKTELPSPTLKLVLIAVCNYADEDGVCWPSQARLARECCLTERSVRDALKRLEEMKLIRREERHDNAYRRQTDMIFIAPNIHRNIFPVEKPPETDARATGISRQKPPERRSGKPLEEPLENHYAPSSRAKAKKKPNYSIEFESQWNEVPKTSDDKLANPGSKADAFIAFERLDAPDRDALFVGWQHYLDWLEEKRKSRADYPITQFVTFINKRLWETYSKEAA